MPRPNPEAGVFATRRTTVITTKSPKRPEPPTTLRGRWDAYRQQVARRDPMWAMNNAELLYVIDELLSRVEALEGDKV